MAFHSFLNNETSALRRRFRRFDGSSAYVHGIMRVLQRTDLQLGVAATMAAGIIQSGLQGGASPGELGLKFAAAVAGPAIAAAFVHFTPRLSSLITGITPSMREDDKVYDQTGVMRSQNHATELRHARVLLRDLTMMELAGACAIVPMWAMHATGSGNVKNDLLLGAINTIFARIAMGRHNYRDIVREKITLVDRVPPLPQAAGPA